MNRTYRYFACDFETTVYEGQARTDVWAAACCELYEDSASIFHGIHEIFEYFVNLKSNLIIYFHNLKFDGHFILDMLLHDNKYRPAFEQYGDDEFSLKPIPDKDMKNNTYKYMISDMGTWYTLTVKTHGRIIQFRDSYKLLPFSLEKIGKNFHTKHQKTKMEYKGIRYPGCLITDEEREYILNDVYVLKEALEIMFDRGHNRITIGSCCLHEYMRLFKHETADEWDTFFPDLYNTSCNMTNHDYGCTDAGSYIRKSYYGGWCYLVEGKENRMHYNGLTADVNSLYPYVMSGKSGNKYPVGKPTFWNGDYIPDDALKEDRYFFVRIKTRFRLKEGYLPFIQVKGTYLYPGNKCLSTSDVYNPKTDEYYQYINENGKIKPTTVELTLTMTDYYRILEHYDLYDFQILDGCYFYTEEGIFDFYIEKYKQIKKDSTGAERELAKLYLNSLYGKMATSTDGSFKFAYLENDVIKFKAVHNNSKKPGYIPIGAAITSYARDYTIRHAQLNYHGKDKPGFIYADTDSIHCDIPVDELIGIEEDASEFGCWKLEAFWDKGWFTRQKTYIEHVTHENRKECSPYYNIKCAGMGKRCKELLIMSLSGSALEKYNENEEEFTEEEKRFLFGSSNKPIIRGMENFVKGFSVPGKLTPKRIPGGIVLTDSYYVMR